MYLNALFEHGEVMVIRNDMHYDLTTFVVMIMLSSDYASLSVTVKTLHNESMILRVL